MGSAGRAEDAGAAQSLRHALSARAACAGHMMARRLPSRGCLRIERRIRGAAVLDARRVGRIAPRVEREFLGCGGLGRAIRVFSRFFRQVGHASDVLEITITRHQFRLKLTRRGQYHRIRHREAVLETQIGGRQRELLID